MCLHEQVLRTCAWLGVHVRDCKCCLHVRDWAWYVRDWAWHVRTCEWLSVTCAWLGRRVWRVLRTCAWLSRSVQSLNKVRHRRYVYQAHSHTTNCIWFTIALATPIENTRVASYYLSKMLDRGKNDRKSQTFSLVAETDVTWKICSYYWNPFSKLYVFIYFHFVSSWFVS